MRPTRISRLSLPRRLLLDHFLSSGRKAEFDGRLVDVIAEGLPIDRGQVVVVTKTRGNRVMVHAADV